MTPHESSRTVAPAEDHSAATGASSKKRKHESIDVAFMVTALESGVLDKETGEKTLVESFRKAVHAREQQVVIDALLSEKAELKADEEQLTANFDFGTRYEDNSLRAMKIIDQLKSIITTGTAPPTPRTASVGE